MKVYWTTNTWIKVVPSKDLPPLQSIKLPSDRWRTAVDSVVAVIGRCRLTSRRLVPLFCRLQVFAVAFTERTCSHNIAWAYWQRARWWSQWKYRLARGVVYEFHSPAITEQFRKPVVVAYHSVEVFPFQKLFSVWLNSDKSHHVAISFSVLQTDFSFGFLCSTVVPVWVSNPASQ